MRAGGNQAAGPALATRPARIANTIDCLGKSGGKSGFANLIDTGNEVGMAQPPSIEGGCELGNR
jgi:hypothetical protein